MTLAQSQRIHALMIRRAAVRATAHSDRHVHLQRATMQKVARLHLNSFTSRLRSETRVPKV